MGGCVEALPYEILMRNASFAECRDFIKKQYKESIIVQPGFRLFDIHIIGVPPVTIGIDGDFVVFPYTKPCHGTFLLRVEDPDEAARLRGMKK
jgi:hypothetical protein